MSGKRGKLFVIAAPSGAGKTSLVRALMQLRPTLRFSISYTTRKQRPNERHSHDYFFVDKAEFERMVAAGDFLEHARVFDNYYGTSRQQVAPGSSNSRNKKVLSAAFGKSIWIVSTCAPVIAKICVARSTSAPVSGWLRRLPISVPSSAQTSIACELGGCPRTACTPAEATSMSLRFPKRRRKRPSAMGLRQTLPVQTKRTLFTRCGRANLRRRRGRRQASTSLAPGVVSL